MMWIETDNKTRSGKRIVQHTTIKRGKGKALGKIQRLRRQK